MLSYKDYRIYVRFVSWKDSLISVKANVACSKAIYSIFVSVC